MQTYALTHLSDQDLLRNLALLVRRDRATTAEMLAHIAEVDARHLYAGAGYSSMFAYCVEELGLSEDAAYKRIQAARAARRFPGIFSAVAHGRLHLTAVRLLAPYLTPENADELLAAAVHQRKSAIERYLARRFPPLAVSSAAPVLRPIRSEPVRKLAPGQVGTSGIGLLGGFGGGSSATPPTEGGQPQQAEPASGKEMAAPAKAASQPERYLLRLEIEGSTHDKLRYAQQLLSHVLPSGDPARVLDRALDALIAKLETRKFAAAAKPRSAPSKRASRPRRSIPASVRRAVWKRDGGRCAFVSKAGKRCGERKFLEFDHVTPLARNGPATVEGMRLLCRAHNQSEAERLLGREFMRRRRKEARSRAGSGELEQGLRRTKRPRRGQHVVRANQSRSP